MYEDLISVEEENLEDEINVEEENVIVNTGGTTDYRRLNNKPSINNVELLGNKSLEDLGIDQDFVKDNNYVHTDNNYTTAEKNKLAGLNNYDDTQVKSDISNLQTNKADKSEIPDVSNFITRSVNDLVNYYLKSDTYTKTEVNNLIGAIQQFHYEIVQTLPSTGANNILYLVPRTTSETNNVYDEYVYANNSWEKIGSTQVDLTGYATETWVNTQIADFLTATQINNLISTALNNYYTKSEANTLLNAKQNTSTLETDVKSFINKAYIESLIDDGNEVSY